MISTEAVGERKEGIEVQVLCKGSEESSGDFAARVGGLLEGRHFIPCMDLDPYLSTDSNRVAVFVPAGRPVVFIQQSEEAFSGFCQRIGGKLKEMGVFGCLLISNKTKLDEYKGVIAIH